MIQLYFLLFLYCFVLSSCSFSKKESTQISPSDQQISIETLLQEDFISEREKQLHAKEFSRLKSEQQKTKPIQVSRVVKDSEQIYLYEAKLADIPVPINAKPVQILTNKNDDSGTIALSYDVNQAPSEIVQFYTSHMDGWQLQSQFIAEESVLTFYKPERICAIYIRPKSSGWSKQKTEIVIFSRLNDLYPDQTV